MKHADHVNLLRPARLAPGGTWADLGAGTGAFTLALRELIGPEATIHAVDRDRASLRQLEQEYGRRFGDTSGLQTTTADIAAPLDVPPLDGVLMANSLHFFKDKVAVLKHVRSMLRPGGRLLIVEYNTDKGNPWVPFPFSFVSLGALAESAGFRELRLLATHPSNFLREIYSAQASAGKVLAAQLVQESS